MKAEDHPAFIFFVIRNRSAAEVPCLQAWPHSEIDFLRVRKKVDEAMIELEKEMEQ
jgi:hypothetical protein